MRLIRVCLASILLISSAFSDTKVDLLPLKEKCAVLPFEVLLVQGFLGPQLLMNSYLYPALLEYKKDENSTGFHCGGSLINDQYILTAAHCVTGDVVTKYGEPFRVRLGEFDRRFEKDLAVYIDFQEKDNVEDIYAEEVIPHNMYNISDVNRYFDIALIRLKQKYTKKEFIKPICFENRRWTNDQTETVTEKIEEMQENKTKLDARKINSKLKFEEETEVNQKKEENQQENLSENDKNKDTITEENDDDKKTKRKIYLVVGWSVTENDDGRYDKRYGFIESISNEECSKYVNITLIDSQFCAVKTKELPDDGILDQACYGDSGSAIISHGKSVDYYLSGIDSIRFTKCDQKISPIVYTNATQFLPWIHDNIRA